MRPVELEIFRRNARLRALRALGLPIDEDTIWAENAAEGPLLWGYCTRCHARVHAWATLSFQKRWIDHVYIAPCEHLRLLFEGDSEELRAMVALELLAGG